MIEHLTKQGTGFFPLPPVFPSQIKIVRVPLQSLKNCLRKQASDNFVQPWLCDEEQARFAAFRYEKRQVEWLAGRIAAKAAVLLLHTQKEPDCLADTALQRVQIIADSAGKPFIIWSEPVGGLPIFISISHSRDYAIAMAARQECGIDIQQVTAAVERVEERFVAEEEKELIKTIGADHGRQAALTQLWSAKEAVKKTAGGVHLPGFLDIRLHSLEKSGDAYLFAVRVKNNMNGEDVCQWVWTRLLAGFAYGLTLRDQG